MGSYKTTRSVTAGYDEAKRAASIPPIEWPTIAAFAMPRCSSTRFVFNAMSWKL